MRPLEYTYQNTDVDRKREVKLIFDWPKQTITNVINGDPWQMELVPEVLDKLLYQLSLMIDLADGKKFMQYIVADGGKIKTYQMHVTGEDSVEMELGKFEVLIVTRKGKNRTTTLWCARELNFLPVKILQEKTDGSRIVAELYKIQGINLPPP